MALRVNKVTRTKARDAKWYSFFFHSIRSIPTTATVRRLLRAARLQGYLGAGIDALRESDVSATETLLPDRHTEHAAGRHTDAQLVPIRGIARRVLGARQTGGQDADAIAAVQCQALVHTSEEYVVPG